MQCNIGRGGVRHLTSARVIWAGRMLRLAVSVIAHENCNQVRARPLSAGRLCAGHPLMKHATTQCVTQFTYDTNDRLLGACRR